MLEVLDTSGAGQGSNERANASVRSVDGVRRIRRQVPQRCTDGLDCLLYTSGFVERHIIDHDDVPALKGGNHTGVSCGGILLSSATEKIPLIRLPSPALGRANAFWGAPRILGELLKLGVEVSQATVGRYV